MQQNKVLAKYEISGTTPIKETEMFLLSKLEYDWIASRIVPELGN